MRKNSVLNEVILQKNKCKKGVNGITLIALIITIVVLLIMAGVTINAISGSESAPAKANEAGQKNDIGAAKDDISLTVTNAKMQGMETAYVGNGVSASEASTTVGIEVIKAVAQKYQENNQIGKATIEIDGFGTIENVTGDATISVSTTDFEIIGIITLEDGNLAWGEIEPNVPAIVDRVEMTSTNLDIEKGGFGSIDIKCYNSSNNLIPVRKLKNITISKKSGSEYISLTQNGANQVIITVDELEEIGEKTIKITTTANNTSIDTEITINVIAIEPIVGQFIEYNVGYTDISSSNHDFTPIDGWRILETGTEDTREGHNGEYIGAKIISTGIPAGLYYYNNDTSTNKSWWGTGTNIQDQVTNGLSTPSKFETIVCNQQSKDEANSSSYYNQGYYTKIVHYNGNLENEIKKSETKTTIYISDLFKITGVAAEVDTLTLTELNKALNAVNSNTARTEDETDMTTLTTANDSKSLFFLRGLGSTYDYSNVSDSQTENCDYWLASKYQASDNVRIMVVGADGSFRSGGYKSGRNYGHRDGLRPVITLSSNVYIKKNETTGRWEIKNVIN